MSKGLVVSYVRLSQEDYDKSEKFSSSIYNQLGFIKSYAESMGFNIDKEYIDDGYSGINFERPSFEELKNDIETGLISVIITKDMSRLGRNFIETSYYIGEYFPKNNIRYIAINDQYDSDNPDDNEQQIIMKIRALINDRYVKDVSVKRKQVADAKTLEGQFIGFLAPYGYKIVKINDKRTLEIDEYASRIVKRIFSEIASGKTRQEVADGLNNDKIAAPMVYMNITPSKGKKYYYDWSDKVIYRILKNMTYIGKIVKRKTLKKDYHQKKRDTIPISDRETINNCHPAIITEELFIEANSKIKTVKKREKNNYSGLFSKLVICGECGSVMTACRVKKENGNIKYYFECTKAHDRQICPNRTIADSKLRIIVKDTLKNLIDSYVDEDNICNEAMENLKKCERPSLKIANLESDIEFHNKKIRDLYLKKTKSEISLEKFLEEKETETMLREQSEKMLKEILEIKNKDLRKREILDKYNKFINNDANINDIIRELIDKIVVYKDNTLELSFKFGLGNPKKLNKIRLKIGIN